MATQPITNPVTQADIEDFTLTAAQIAFMINIDAAAERADAADDYDFFDGVVASDAWRGLFGDMSWDQAYDRYEIMIGRCEDC